MVSKVKLSSKPIQRGIGFAFLKNIHNFQASIDKIILINLMLLNIKAN